MVRGLLRFAVERAVHPEDPPGLDEMSKESSSWNESRREDVWTVKYLNDQHMEGLVEALDVDASTVVTVAEVNSFSRLRPFDWR